MDTDRAAVLLRAAFDILRRAEMSRYTECPLTTIIIYDGDEGNGHGLKSDIAEILGIEDDSHPLR